jgi:hypothetical protein
MDASFSNEAANRQGATEESRAAQRSGLISILPADVTPDYKTARRYVTALHHIDMNLVSHRQQVVFTNDVDSVCRTIANYILGVKPLISPDDGFLVKVLATMNLSNEEAFVTGPDPRRSAPREFKEVIRFEFGSPEFSAILTEVARGRPLRKYEEPTELHYLMDHSWSDLFVDFFEARANQTLFIGTLRPPEDPAARAEFYANFARQHSRLEDHEGDYADCFYKVPQIIWVAPYALTHPFQPLSVLTAAHTNLFSAPYQNWCSCADATIPRQPIEIQGLIKDTRFAIYTNRLHLYCDLLTLSCRLRNIQAEARKTDTEMMDLCGFSAEEWAFLMTTNFDFDYIRNNPESPLHPSRALAGVLKRITATS